MLIAFDAAYGYCQPSERTDQIESCSFAEIYSKAGWSIPGLDRATVKNPRARLTNLPGVFVTILQPGEPETTFQRIGCSREHVGRLEIEKEPVKILELWSYDFDGRVFAYRISFAREAVSDGVRSELAAASTVFFYDMDGHGVFTILRNVGGGLDAYRPMVPDWTNNIQRKTKE
jgi:hypothetical protein